MENEILVVGEGSNLLDPIKQALSDAKYRPRIVSVDTIPTDAEALPDFAVLAFPKESFEKVLDVIARLHDLEDALPILVVSNEENWQPVVSLLKAGASDYVHFPFEPDALIATLSRYLKLYQITKKVYRIDETRRQVLKFEGMIGKSPRMQENFKMIQAVSKSNATVLITGESGTGKELVAKAIHRYSNRASHRFVDLNCGAIPRDLLENELFGHEKGSFTGAHRRYQGSFEAANNGSLFLDEISEMDPLLQVKLLRVLQERNFTRIGGNERIDVDVRIIAATNRNLEKSIAAGQFREDLYYRLNVVNISIPALRERREDIPLLAAHFLEYFSAKNDRIFLDFSSDAMEALINYDWPGNVRELENTIERVVVLHNDSQVKLKYLPKNFQQVTRSIPVATIDRSVPAEMKVVPLDEIEKNAIIAALSQFQGNVAVAAKKLEIGQATLYRKIKRYGLE